MFTDKEWTPRELRLLRELYPDLTAATVAREIGRSATSVYAMASRLGLRKTGVSQPEPAADVAQQREGESGAPYLGARYSITVLTEGLPTGITSVRQYRLQGDA